VKPVCLRALARRDRASHMVVPEAESLTERKAWGQISVEGLTYHVTVLCTVMHSATSQCDSSVLREEFKRARI